MEEYLEKIGKRQEFSTDLRSKLTNAGWTDRVFELATHKLMKQEKLDTQEIEKLKTEARNLVPENVRLELESQLKSVVDSLVEH